MRAQIGVQRGRSHLQYAHEDTAVALRMTAER